jgi:hypothetical protein
MATRSSVQAKVICYPKGKTPYRTNHGFIVADILGDRMTLLGGDSAGLSLQMTNPTISTPWLNSASPAHERAENVSFVRFYKDGTFKEQASTSNNNDSELAGYILNGRIAPLDSMVPGATVTASNTDLNWVVIQGKWRSGLSPEMPPQIHLLNTGRENTAMIRTKGKIPANRSLAFNVKLMARTGSTAQPSVRIAWGDKYSIVLRHGNKPAVDKKVNGVWAEWKTLDDAKPVRANGGYYAIRIRRIAGRLVININQQGFWLAETKPGTSASDIKGATIEWPEMPLQVNAFSVSVRFTVSVIKYATPSGEGFTGYFEKTFVRKTPVVGQRQQALSGWSRDGLGLSVTSTTPDNKLNYTVNMRSDSDGLDTPFVKSVIIRALPEWSTESPAGIDIAPACKNYSIDLAIPPSVPSAQASILVDRILLGGFVDVDWRTYVAADHVIEIQQRDVFESETEDIWQTVFYGYITQDEWEDPSYNEELFKITALDPMWLMQGENAKIDYRFAPLDLLLATVGGNAENLKIYGSDCVKELMQNALGTAEAERLNGNGNGERFFAEHYPLLDTQSDTGGYLAVMGALNAQPPIVNSFLFPPPFDEDVMSWILKIAAYDDAMFYYGYPEGYPPGDTPVRPYPLYGRIFQLMAGRPTYELPDKVYSTGDENKVLTRLAVRSHPEKRINTVQVWSLAPEGSLGQLIPAVRIAEGRLPASDRNSVENRRLEKKWILKEEIGVYPGVAESIMLGILAELRNVDYKWPDATFHGIAKIQVFDKVKFKLTTIPYLQTEISNDIEFRVERVRHDVDLENIGPDMFLTTISTRPLAASEVGV